MRKLRISLLLVTIATTLATAQRPIQLFEILADTSTSDETWKQTAEEFQKIPALERMRTLLPEVSTPSTNGIFNCSDVARDRKLNGVGRRCVAAKFWCDAILCQPRSPEVSQALLELWHSPQILPAQSVLLSALCNDPMATSALETEFRDVRADADFRARSASCLTSRGSQYHAEIVDFAVSSPSRQQDLLFRALTSPPYAAKSERDPRVVAMGFHLIAIATAEAQNISKSSHQPFSDCRATDYARSLGTYLGQPFTPDGRQPQYDGPEGQERLCHQIVGNASHWWSLHRAQYSN